MNRRVRESEGERGRKKKTGEKETQTVEVKRSAQ